ncbi:endonuclease V-like protein [Nocardia nova SH22a]|uniref:Endonuclease V-like protein n=1 Tax=Nocardia nova SH22a TaxID=1415166 RepID=W5TM37_9NOCA|nr:endonuclease V [Nocardia nova]AHH20322.1 endonuclease V-like protein [Nocardia nova SH22a]
MRLRMPAVVPADPEAAVALQNRLRAQVITADPGSDRGSATDITIDGEVVGRALRTRSGVKPVYVSVGHRIGLDTACATVLALTPRCRRPETTRRADHLCRTLLRADTAC